MQSVYFGGSRSLAQGSPASFTLAHVTHAVLLEGHKVHVGCATGADQQVIHYVMQAYSGQFTSSLSVFASFGLSGPIEQEQSVILGTVHKYPFIGYCSASAVHQVMAAHMAGVSVSWWAGGSASVPLAARLIRRSQAAFQGCAEAVFFSPGAGSLAVAGYAVKAGLSVFAFSQSAPAPLAGLRGQWCITWFHGFQCWGWGRLSSDTAQLSLF